LRQHPGRFVFSHHERKERAMKNVKLNRSPASVRRAPRNPLVALVLFRHAGVHGASRKTERQAAARALRKLIDER
jgi:hypothetical protein